MTSIEAAKKLLDEITKEPITATVEVSTAVLANLIQEHVDMKRQLVELVKHDLAAEIRRQMNEELGENLDNDG